MVPSTPSSAHARLPVSAWAALARGLRGRCPRCGEARLFRRWLKPLASCPACAVDWMPQQADDFPAYISILVTGHLLAPGKHRFPFSKVYRYNALCVVNTGDNRRQYFMGLALQAHQIKIVELMA